MVASGRTAYPMSTSAKAMPHETRLVIALDTLRFGALGQATAGLWLETEDSQFPAPEWDESIVIALGWWSAALLSLTKDPSRTERVRFMEGPYAVELSRPAPGELHLRMIAHGREVAAGVANFRRFVADLTPPSRRLLHECRTRDRWSPAAEALSLSLEELRRELTC